MLRAPAPLIPLAECGVAALVALGGFALAAWLFYPGIATHDSLAVYDQAQAWSFGDWQPPLMGVLWLWLERIFGYGPKAIFWPTIGIYWLAFFALFLGLRRESRLGAWLILIVGFLPPTFVLLGVIWRDVIFSALWLLAFALAFATSGRSRGLRFAALALGVPLVLIGFWLRPNALFAAVPLLIYLVWPNDWRWRRLLLLAVPLSVGLQLSTNAINYGWLAARPDHVSHSILVFDLAGISHFADQNVFPIDSWTPEQVEKLKSTCYQPNYWDAIWWLPCTFAMERINRDVPPGTKLFGSDRLVRAWADAILAHPLAYLRHRLAYFGALMTWENMVMFDQDNSGQFRFLFIKSSAYSMLESAVLWLNANTPLFRGLTWLILSAGLALLALRFPNGRGTAAVQTLAWSGLLFTLTYLPFGVAAEYRYVYWTAMSGLAGTVIALAKWQRMRAEDAR